MLALCKHCHWRKFNTCNNFDHMSVVISSYYYSFNVPLCDKKKSPTNRPLFLFHQEKNGKLFDEQSLTKSSEFDLKSSIILTIPSSVSPRIFPRLQMHIGTINYNSINYNYNFSFVATQRMWLFVIFILKNRSCSSMLFQKLLFKSFRHPSFSECFLSCLNEFPNHKHKPRRWCMIGHFSKFGKNGTFQLTT